MDNVILFIFIILSPSTCRTDSSFILSFQSTLSFSKNSEVSVDEWGKFNGKIQNLKEFTACHWEYLNFFNQNQNSVWSYCISGTNNRNFKCLQYNYLGNEETAQRHITGKIEIDLESFHDFKFDI